MNGFASAVVLEGMDLTDAQWAVLEPMFRPRRRPDGRGRPWTDSRRVLDAVLWILRTPPHEHHTTTRILERPGGATGNARDLDEAWQGRASRASDSPARMASAS